MGGGASTDKKVEPKGSSNPSPPANPTKAAGMKPPDSDPPKKPENGAKKEAWGLHEASVGTPKGKPCSVTLAPQFQSNEGLVMAADVGGTNSRFMLYAVDGDEPVVLGRVAPGRLITVKKYSNLRFKGFEDVVQAFVDDATAEGMMSDDLRPLVACLAVAGVVEANICRLTNLDWIIDGNALEQRFNIREVEVINDFVAQGYGVLTLTRDEKIHLSGPEEPIPNQAIACIGAGTGLGQCFLTPGMSGEYCAWPSEGGHQEFAPRGAGNDDTQIELLKYLKIKFSGWNRISYERVVSGKGICNTYEFLAYKEPGRIDKEVHKEFLESRQDAGIIAKNARPGTLCHEALEIFADCYGACCGTFALNIMPFGGLYISGGVTQKLHDFLQSSPKFIDAFLDKGRVSPMLHDVPVYFVKGDEMGQRGAHLRAVRLYQHERGDVSRQQSKAVVRKASALRTISLVPPRNLQFADLVKEMEPDEAVAEVEVKHDRQTSSVSRQVSYSLPAPRCSTPM
jgi:glucokinase